MQLLEQAGHGLLSSCDNILKEFGDFARYAAINDDFRTFQVGQSRLDTLYYNALQDNRWPSLWTLLQNLLLLSHGQAAVERGFSINSETLTDSMSENTLIALRTIKDHLLSIGGRAECVPITPELLTSAAAAVSNSKSRLLTHALRSEHKFPGTNITSAITQEPLFLSL